MHSSYEDGASSLPVPEAGPRIGPDHLPALSPSLLPAAVVFRLEINLPVNPAGRSDDDAVKPNIWELFKKKDAQAHASQTKTESLV